MNRVKLVLISLFSAVAVQAAPSIKIGSISGAAGDKVSIPVMFDAGNTKVSMIQFDLKLPSGIKPGTVTEGKVLKAANKNVSSNFMKDSTWRFVIGAFNKETMKSGPLFTAQIEIPSDAPIGVENLAISNELYSDPRGEAIKSGPSQSGTLKITVKKNTSI